MEYQFTGSGLPQGIAEYVNHVCTFIGNGTGDEKITHPSG